MAGKQPNIGGISMWKPHRFPTRFCDKRNGGKVKKFNSTCVLPEEFIVVSDRTYEASIGGNNVSFTHYVLTPSGQFQESVLHAACSYLIADDCTDEAGDESYDLRVVDFDECERAVGPMYAGQYALKSFASDQRNSGSDCRDAFLLYAWLGSLEATIDELVDLSPWASEFILEAMKKYDLALPNDSNFLLHYGEAVDSLQYQLQKFYSVHQATVAIPRP
jgi:hypothetical protein